LENKITKTAVKKQNFLCGAAIIAASHIIIKIIGAIFKIPLDAYILKTEGMGIYNSAYTIYNWLFMLSTAGLPVAISKMVSESYARGNAREAERVFSIAKALMLVFGICGFSILFFGAKPFSKLLSAPSASLAMMTLAPSLLFTAMMSAYRGYSQGMNNMIPTAVSEVVESLGKLCMGLFLALYFLPMGIEYAAAGAIGGVTFGTLFAFIVLWTGNKVISKRLKKDKASYTNATDAKSGRQILKSLIATAIPITLGVSVFTLTSLIDTTMIMNQLAHLGYGETQRLSLYGYLTRAVTMFNVPPTVIAAISVSVVPTISAAISRGARKHATETAKSALRITILFAFPCAVGLSVMASPILQLLYHDASHSFLLNVMGLAVACVTLVQTSNAILQAYGHVWRPVVNMAIGGAVKVITNLILVSNPEININGAPIGTFLCYLTVMTLNMISIKKITGITYELSDFVVKPLLSVIVMGAATVICYDFIFRITSQYVISLLCAIAFACVVYGVMIFFVRCVKKEDIILLPKGDKIYALLVRLHIMK